MKNRTDKLLNTKEVAERLNCSTSYVRQNYAKWIDKGVIPLRLSGGNGTLRFKESEIEQFIDRSRICPAG
jgi:excisionase family DNA binding protein